MFFLSKLNKLTIFHSFILSNFNFCPLAWHFCSKANTIKLEKIQERALRFIYEDYNSTYEELLHIAKVPSLQIRRMRTIALECFKILYKLSPPCLNDLVVLKNSKYSFRYSNIVEIPRVKTTTYDKNSFKYITAVLWKTYLMILEKLPILNNLKTFYYLGMEKNANVKHVKKINIIKVFSIFILFIFIYFLGV